MNQAETAADPKLKYQIKKNAVPRVLAHRQQPSVGPVPPFFNLLAPPSSSPNCLQMHVQ
jgi:hypothetical protein